MPTKSTDANTTLLMFLEVLGISGDGTAAQILSKVDNMTPRQRLYFMYALKGTGLATEEFEPDGVLGVETFKSVINLFNQPDFPE